MVTLKIEKDDLTRPDVHALLEEHLQSMYELSPPESVHALDLERLEEYLCTASSKISPEINNVSPSLRTTATRFLILSMVKSRLEIKSAET
jgi:hypothetical protein